MIERGEGEMLDFKKEITSVHRIARTMVSFANHYGGTLLVGVNDNKTISGIKPDEERFMLEKAAGEFCYPPINLSINEWILNGKIILEVKIEMGINKPFFAIDESGKKWVYIRHKDESMLASKIVVDILKRKHSTHETIIKFSSKEKALLDFLKVHPQITVKEFCKLIKISKWSAMKTMVNLVSVDILNVNETDKPESFSLK